jgi:shikimate kinase
MGIHMPRVFKHGAFARGGCCVYSPAAMQQSLSPPSRKIDRPIVLVGLMGSGKSTVGKRLAARLGLPFVDADHEIEAAAGLSITEIFERFGEPHFRDGERRVIGRLIDGSPKVIATGGGAFMNEETRALILARATAIWLDADIDTLAERVGRRDGSRPLLRNRNPREVLAELAAVRNPIYALAPIHIHSQPVPHEATVDAIMKALSL